MHVTVSQSLESPGVLVISSDARSTRVLVSQTFSAGTNVQPTILSDERLNEDEKDAIWKWYEERYSGKDVHRPDCRYREHSQRA